MPLSVANLVPLTHYVKTTDISQFYDLLTGAMTDQPVTLANALNLTKAGTALTITNNATIGGTLAVTGNAAFGSLSSGVITCGAIDATTGQMRSLVNGASGGFLAGNVVGAPDVQWYRSAADTWRTPDSVVIDVALTVTGASLLASAGVTGLLTAGSIAARKATTAYPANGALAISDGLVQLTKAGVNAMTLADPASGDDGTLMIISAATANAHTVTNAGSGFNNGGGASDVATFGGAIGDYLAVFASGSRWWVLANRNVTLA